MNKLDEIFKNNTALLDEPEVKELIDYCEKQYAKVFERYKELEEFEYKIMRKCAESNFFFTNGISSRETLKSIVKLIDDYCL